MASVANKQHRRPNNHADNLPRMSKQVVAVKQMVASLHTVLVGREHNNGKRSFKSFLTLKTVHKWMGTLPDSERNLYQVDLSAWDHKSLNDTERKYIKELFVSPFVCDVEWPSVDALPDPLAEKRIAVLKTVVLQALEIVSPAGFSAKAVSIEVEHLGRKPKGKPYFKNSYHLVVPGIVFEHNAKGCMKDFVVGVLMPEIEKNKEMLWISNTGPLKGSTCILDKSIYSRGRQMRMPGCCKFGGVGLPLATLDELHRMRTSYCVREMSASVQITTEAMMGMLCPAPPACNHDKKRNNNRKKNKKRTREAVPLDADEEGKQGEGLDKPQSPHKKGRREATKQRAPGDS
jgi:hypothetical protein